VRPSSRSRSRNAPPPTGSAPRQPRRTSYPLLSLRATRSRGHASGPRVGASRRIGRGCIRGRRVAVAVVESGGAGWLRLACKHKRGAGPQWQPAPLALESGWLGRVRPVCDGGTCSSRHNPDRRGPSVPHERRSARRMSRRSRTRPPDFSREKSCFVR
jgi:hypothetical protein